MALRDSGLNPNHEESQDVSQIAQARDPSYVLTLEEISNLAKAAASPPKP